MKLEDLLRYILDSPNSSTEKKCQRALGVVQCVGGCTCCPVFSVGTLMVGTGMTLHGYVTSQCGDPEWVVERNMWCTCCGLGSGCAISSALVLTGYVNAFNIETEPVYRHQKKGWVMDYHSETVL